MAITTGVSELYHILAVYIIDNHSTRLNLLDYQYVTINSHRSETQNNHTPMKYTPNYKEKAISFIFLHYIVFFAATAAYAAVIQAAQAEK